LADNITAKHHDECMDTSLACIIHGHMWLHCTDERVGDWVVCVATAFITTWKAAVREELPCECEARNM